MAASQRGETHGGGRSLHMRARSGERQYLGIDALLPQDLLAVIDVAVAGDGDVVVAGIEDARVAVVIDGHLDGACAGAQGVEIGGGIEVVVEVDDHRGRIQRE